MIQVTDPIAPPEEIVLLKDPCSGLHGTIVIHSTVLGPAAGGCRFWDYGTDAELTSDALRLAEGMCYKNAIADLPLGGGKAVIRRPVGAFDRTRLFAAFGRAVEELGGRYVTAEDVGTCVEDMRSVRASTRHVAGLPTRAGLPGGDPSPWTALGVFLSMKVAVEQQLERSLADCTVAIQGVGSVGFELAKLLHGAGAKLLVADVDPAKLAHAVRATGAGAMAAPDLLRADADVFAPCALGEVLTPTSVPTLRAKVVCGAANNQLSSPEAGDLLSDRGVLYAPDYVVNAGGIVNVAAEHLGWTKAAAAARVNATGSRLQHVLALARSAGISSNAAADRLAREIIASRGAGARLVA